MKTAFLFLGLLGPLMAQAAGPAAPHVHGTAELRIVADGDQLEVQLETPLENLVGFEHAPRTEKQREAIRAMAARLRRPEALFTPTPQASCVPAVVRLSSPVLPPQLLGEAPSAAQSTGDAGGHADLDASFVFRCASPERLVGLETSLGKAFRGLRTIKVHAVGPRGQKASTLDHGRTKVEW